MNLWNRRCCVAVGTIGAPRADFRGLTVVVASERLRFYRERFPQPTFRLGQSRRSFQRYVC